MPRFPLLNFHWTHCAYNCSPLTVKYECPQLSLLIITSDLEANNIESRSPSARIHSGKCEQNVATCYNIWQTVATCAHLKQTLQSVVACDPSVKTPFASTPSASRWTSLAVSDVGVPQAGFRQGGGLQGYCLTYTVKGPQFEEAKSQIVSRHEPLEEPQNDS